MVERRSPQCTGYLLSHVHSTCVHPSVYVGGTGAFFHTPWTIAAQRQSPSAISEGSSDQHCSFQDTLPLLGLSDILGLSTCWQKQRLLCVTEFWKGQSCYIMIVLGLMSSEAQRTNKDCQHLEFSLKTFGFLFWLTRSKPKQEEQKGCCNI